MRLQACALLSTWRKMYVTRRSLWHPWCKSCIICMLAWRQGTPLLGLTTSALSIFLLIIITEAYLELELQSLLASTLEAWAWWTPSRMLDLGLSVQKRFQISTLASYTNLQRALLITTDTTFWHSGLFFRVFVLALCNSFSQPGNIVHSGIHKWAILVPSPTTKFFRSD